MSSFKAANESFARRLGWVCERGRPGQASLADVIQWFLDYDQRVSAIKHPAVEKLFPATPKRASKRVATEVAFRQIASAQAFSTIRYVEFQSS